MPKINVLFFDEKEFDKWLYKLPKKVKDKALDSIMRLSELGHEIRRPHADFLRNGVYELRFDNKGVHVRILYFFVGDNAIISHGFSKTTDSVPPKKSNEQ